MFFFFFIIIVMTRGKKRSEINIYKICLRYLVYTIDWSDPIGHNFKFPVGYIHFNNNLNKNVTIPSIHDEFVFNQSVKCIKYAIISQYTSWFNVEKRIVN